MARPVESLESMKGVVDVVGSADFTDSYDQVGTDIMLRQIVDETLAGLTGREREVLQLKFGFTDGQPRTFAQVGQVIGRSRWTASRIMHRALGKLRHPESRLEDYFEPTSGV